MCLLVGCLSRNDLDQIDDDKSRVRDTYQYLMKVDSNVTSILVCEN